MAVDDPGQLAAAIDRIVAVADPDAVRQVRERARDREVSIWNSEHGRGVRPVVCHRRPSPGCAAERLGGHGVCR
ncbi:DUF222 domain-containing protein [Mycobacterium canettii]|nr:DUF222 domain-containing protein [Mycobacterium canetti]